MGIFRILKMSAKSDGEVEEISPKKPGNLIKGNI
jgi:hypothetical protein